MSRMESPLYNTRITPFSRDLTLLVRHHFRQKEGSEIDTYGTNWLLIITDIKRKGDLVLNRFGEKLAFEGATAIFAPPYSLIEWSFKPGFYHWMAFRSDRLDDRFPREPIAFSWRPSYRIDDFNDIVKILSSLDNFESVGKQENYSPKAMAIKKLIDDTFREQLSMKELAGQLGLTSSEMGRIFKRCYSLSPLAYRNKLRVFYSLKLMIVDEQNITESSFECGFEEVSSFQRNFKKSFGLSPTSFLSDNNLSTHHEYHEVCSIRQEDVFHESSISKNFNYRPNRNAGTESSQSI